MGAYVLRRLLLVIPTVLLASVIIFLLTHLIPGDIIDAMLAESGADTELDRAAIEHALGLDESLAVQYGRWLGVVPQPDGRLKGVLEGDLGLSWRQRMPVLDLVGSKWPITFQLGLMSLLIAQLIALPIGVYSALRQDTWGDYFSRSFAILCIAVPGFWLGTMIIVFPSIWWGYMPSINYIPFFEDPIGNLKMFIVPAVIMGMAMSGGTMRMTRTMMLEVMRQDYIRTAWSKGLKERVVVARHALKNALIPVVTIIGLQMPVMIGGAVIIEQIFVLPGMGRMLLDSILQRDYSLASGILFLFSIVLVLINLMVDLVYSMLDPRVNYR